MEVKGQLAIPSGPNMLPDGFAAAGLKVCLLSICLILLDDFSFIHVSGFSS